jgi:hypothetical protein
MAGLVPAIHDLFACRTKKKSVDGRHKAGHDDSGDGRPASSAQCGRYPSTLSYTVPRVTGSASPMV